MNEALRELLSGNIVNETGKAYQVLKSNKDEMERVNRRGADEYYHPKAMYENAVEGPLRGALGLTLGTAKEGYDMVKKSDIFPWGTMPAAEAWDDSKKDLKNNLMGAILGTMDSKIPVAEREPFSLDRVNKLESSDALQRALRGLK
jgi:hypothetical protein